MLTLAKDAAQKVLAAQQVQIHDIDLIICTTGTPSQITPSLACQLLYELAGSNYECPAYDLNAACSGYLYSHFNLD